MTFNSTWLSLAISSNMLYVVCTGEMWNQLTALQHQICIISLRFRFIPSNSVTVLCFPEKGIHHTSFIGANNWKFTFTITRAGRRAGTSRAKYKPWSVSGRDCPGPGWGNLDHNKRHDEWKLVPRTISHTRGKWKVGLIQKQWVFN